MKRGEETPQEDTNSSVGDLVEVVTADATFKGSLLPRYTYLKPDHIVIKLDNGYN
ncbi:MAG: hypothetical protein ACE5KG_03655, partial [Nitrososphaerales archaeon]